MQAASGVVAGFPCQAPSNEAACFRVRVLSECSSLHSIGPVPPVTKGISAAGLMGGMADSRSGLVSEIWRIADLMGDDLQLV